MLSIKVEGLEDLQARLRAIPAELDRELRPAMHRAVVLMTEDAQGRIYSNTGRARAGIKATESGSGANVQGSIKARGAAKRSIKGRPPGKAPRMGAVRKFMARAGRPVTKAEAFLIARAIGQRGMKGHPVMETSRNARQGDVLSILFEALKRALKAGG